MKKFDYIVFIGRMNPPHNGHLQVIKKALEYSDNLIILLGSADSTRCPRNPFTFEERKNMVYDSIRENHLLYNTLSILPLNDYPYSDETWKKQVYQKIEFCVDEIRPSRYYSVGLIGAHKDNSSYYLDIFPDLELIDMEMIENGFIPMSSTTIRNIYFSSNRFDISSLDNYLSYNVPICVKKFLLTFPKDIRDYLTEWNEYDKNYKEAGKYYPYPIFTACADAIVTWGKRILLINRKNQPGKNLLALPGGHVNEFETFRHAAIRELMEETKISCKYSKKLTFEYLDSCIIDDGKLFDYPYRSSRGRVITQAFIFRLPEHENFKIMGSDDAASANWFYIDKLQSQDFFEDHFHLIMSTVGEYK